MNHKKIVDEIINNCYCSKKDLPDLVVHELRHMGLDAEDFRKCVKELSNFMKESL